MGRKYQVISGDGHLETPPDFVKFVPEKFKDRAPRLITLPDGGGDAWLMEGMPLTYASQNLKGRGVVKFAGQSYFNDDGSRAEGTGDGVQRLREQDEDGIDAEILFAPVFASRFLEKIPERDVYMAMVQAYNTWLIEDYSAPAPDRLIVQRLDADQRHRRRDRRARTRAHARASRPCRWCSTRTAAAGRSPRTTGSGRSHSSSAWRCRRTSASAGRSTSAVRATTRRSGRPRPG